MLDLVSYFSSNSKEKEKKASARRPLHVAMVQHWNTLVRIGLVIVSLLAMRGLTLNYAVNNSEAHNSGASIRGLLIAEDPLTASIDDAARLS